MSDCLKKLGLKFTGGNHTSIRKYILHYGIDFSHFKGKGWAKGLSSNEDSSVAAGSRATKLEDAKALSENGPGWLTGGKLSKRLVARGFQEKCAVCGLVEWQGKTLKLDVDHINGVPNDNRVENLRFLCPNCHRQTPTWGNKKRKTVL